jgi:hypothetical protein
MPKAGLVLVIPLHGHVKAELGASGQWKPVFSGDAKAGLALIMSDRTLGTVVMPKDLAGLVLVIPLEDETKECKKPRCARTFGNL